MRATAGPTRNHGESALHEIRVQGRLDDRWAQWADGLTFTHESDGTTTVTGPIADQAALHGLLNRIRDLNVPVVSVRRVGSGGEAAEDGGNEGQDTGADARSTTMRAIVQDRYGASDTLRLEEVAKPVVGDDEVLIRVRAASVHSGDWHIMTGQPYLMRAMGFGLHGPKARVRGMDVAGTVETAGKNVTQFRAGDDVFGTCDGAFAEYAAARPHTLAPKPANLTFEQAAAVPTSAVVAFHGLRRRGEIQSGQSVLIIGASGGVGMFAVQIAKALGAEVTGVCSTGKMDAVRSLGADHVVDYTREDVTRSGRRYDLILDTVGNSPLSQLRRTLTPGGTLVLVGGEGGNRLTGGALLRSLRALVLSPFVSHRLRPMVALANSADLQALTDLIEAGKVTPVIDRVYSLGEGPDAMRHLAAGTARGKLVIAV
jgi:NADPH:quinone reductase-like Zn-dependent oxidoreductase